MKGGKKKWREGRSEVGKEVWKEGRKGRRKRGRVKASEVLI